MSGGGRPRKPTHLKVVSGTVRNHRVNKDEPVPLSDLPDAPAWLSPRAAEIFQELLGIIAAMDIASASDRAILAMAASRLEEVEICTATIEDGGRFFMSACDYDKQGRMTSQQIKGHPAVAQRSEAMRHAQSLLVEFGLSPAARSKVSASKKKPEANPFAALG